MKIIYIVSTGRSGSTLVDVILGNTSQGHSLGEVYSLFRPFKKQHLDKSCICQDAECPFQKVLETSTLNELHLDLLEKTNKSYLVDSSKDLNYLYQSVNSNLDKNVEMYFLLIYKSPISLSYSHYKRDKPIDSWLHYYKYYQEFLKWDQPFLALKYEDFIDNPQKIIAEICQSFGMTYSNEMIEFWNNPMHHYFGSRSIHKIYTSENPKIYGSEISKEFPDLFNKSVGGKLPDWVIKLLARFKARDVSQNISSEQLAIKKPIEKNFGFFKRQLFYNVKKIKNGVIG